jgi:hypothetical protein
VNINIVINALLQTSVKPWSPALEMGIDIVSSASLGNFVSLLRLQWIV